MAAFNPNPALPLHNINLDHPPGFPQAQRWRPAPDTATAQYLHEMDQVNNLTALHRRIAVLETQLAQAQADKVANEQTTRYLVQVAVNSQEARSSYNSNDGRDQEKLETELRQVKRTNTLLREKVRKVIHLWSNNVQSQGEASRDNSSIEVSEKSPPHSEGYRTNANVTLPTSEGTLVDLLDMNEVTDRVPELDYSETGSSTTPDDVDSLDAHLPDLPKIDLGLYSNNTKQHILNPLSKNTPDVTNSSYLRMFTNSLDTGSGSAGIGVNSGKVHEVDLTSEDANPVVNCDPAKITTRDSVPESQNQRLTLEISGSPLRSGVSLTKAIHLEQGISAENPTIGECKSYPSSLLWAGNPLATENKSFTTAIERSLAMNNNRHSAGPEDLKVPDFFRYGIQYNPSIYERNTLRTVSIMGLHPKITKSELFDNIRGGFVISVELLNTVSITGTLSALVQFLYERDALAFDDSVRQNPLRFHGKAAYVRVLSTPTWPLSPNLSKAILQLKHTRCLEVHDFPREVGPVDLRHDLRAHDTLTYDNLERINMRADGVLELGFTSIYAAGKGYGILTGFRRYQKCRVLFAVDPCSLPPGTLKTPPVHTQPTISVQPTFTEITVAEETSNTNTTSQDLANLPETAAAATTPEPNPKADSTIAIKKNLLQCGLLASSWAASKNATNPNTTKQLPPITCYYCKREGHKASDCQQQLAATRGLSCTYCKQNGHLERFCREKQNTASTTQEHAENGHFVCTYCKRDGHLEKYCYEKLDTRPSPRLSKSIPRSKPANPTMEKEDPPSSSPSSPDINRGCEKAVFIIGGGGNDEGGLVLESVVYEPPSSSFSSFPKTGNPRQELGGRGEKENILIQTHTQDDGNDDDDDASRPTAETEKENLPLSLPPLTYDVQEYLNGAS